jgi:hypothetical protein
MVMRLIQFHPSLAVLTDPVTSRTLMWPEHEYDITYFGSVGPLVVSPVSRNLERAYIILDGNHRACLCGKHGCLVPAYVMTKRTTPDEIIDLEANELIRFFPHREFLAGNQTFRDLMKAANQAPLELNETVAQALERIQRTE